jgi:hypothetical protein
LEISVRSLSSQPVLACSAQSSREFPKEFPGGSECTYC